MNKIIDTKKLNALISKRNNEQNKGYSEYTDLNEVVAKTGYLDHKKLPMRVTSLSSGDIEVCFQNIESFIIAKIKEHSFALGCMAWLTNKNILRALNSTFGYQLILNKEEYMKRSNELYSMYNGIKYGCGDDLFVTEIKDFPYTDSSNELDMFRVAGYDEGVAPRMHDKFLILCKQDETCSYRRAVPHMVITGSYNYTQSSNASLENVVCISNKEIVNAYYTEYLRIFAISEDINWDYNFLQYGR